MCFGEPEPLQGRNWADAGRLSPRWNHCHWRDLFADYVRFRLSRPSCFGGRFLRPGTSLPLFPCLILHAMPGSKRICWHRVFTIGGRRTAKVPLHNCNKEMVRALAKKEGDQRARLISARKWRWCGFDPRRPREDRPHRHHAATQG